MILLQLSASQGPQECALAVAKALDRLMREARECSVRVEAVELVPGAKAGTFLSALLTLEGEAAAMLARRWCGTVQWICASPYRPNHGRKNWFIGVAAYDEPPAAEMSEVRFESCRASGPGGQHVNCQGEPNFPQLWELKIPHPVQASVSCGRTRPAFNFSFKRYELPRMFSVTA